MGMDEPSGCVGIFVEGFAGGVGMAGSVCGVMVSAGSACSSGKVKPSKTISAMGLNALATGGVRVSGGWGTTESDWSRFADAWIAAYDKHKTRAAARVREVA